MERWNIKLFEVLSLLSIIYLTRVIPLFWWLRLQGRDEEVESRIAHIAPVWSRRVMERLHCRVEVVGREHMPKEGPVVLMVNHQSMYDIPVLVGYLGRPMGFLAKKELFRIPGLAYWMRQIHCWSLDRGDAGGTGRIYEALAQELKAQGRAFILFPEGTRSRDPDGRIQSFRQGSLRLAADHGLPIVPVSLDGTRYFSQMDALKRTHKGGRLVRLCIAPPVYPGPMSAPERKRFMEEIRNTIVSNWEAIRVQWPTEPGVE